MNNPNFWNDKDNSEVLIKELSNLKNIITAIAKVNSINIGIFNFSIISIIWSIFTSKLVHIIS